jgi:5-carboxymethyl-2-hydroxymuconate isomerase
MPHIILELSDNIIEQNFTQMMHRVNQILAQELPAKIEDCKGRILRYKEYYIADLVEHGAFAHMSIKILSGRNIHNLNQSLDKISSLMQSHFLESREKLNLNMSVSIEDLPRLYRKI